MIPLRCRGGGRHDAPPRGRLLGRRARRRHARHLPRPARHPAADARPHRRRLGRRLRELRPRPDRRHRRSRRAARRGRSGSTKRGIHSAQALPEGRGAACIFEHVYFARPDSRLGGSEIHASRVRMGQRLAEEAPVDADLVMPIPDSGTPLGD